ncbi:transmembrane secretion effector [Micromonospora pisi]|uniref:Transmembrane secretion effector n=1 Tax=Micromonospora pisi TaxID=589240 RepID=A0A495JML1_9ACTN|nr:MFS transporter [Micromonospora pisi]RKR90153.1 transmembrane secretion effector [Micromonospora pisi]
MGRRGPLAGLLTAELISLIGSRMSMIALPWFTLVSTGSAAMTGVVAFAEMLPYVLACAFGGPFIDRVGARRTSIVADLSSAAVVVAVPLLYRADLLALAALAGLVAVAGLLRGFGDSAKQVVFPETVAAAGVEMTRATSLHDGLARLATLLGAPLAGVLIAALDAPTVLLLDAATFGIGALIIAVTVPGPRRTAVAERECDPVEVEPYLVAMRAGLRFIWQNRLLRGMLLMVLVTNLADAAYGTVLAPVWARDVIGSPVALGLLSAAFAVGAVLGNVVFTVLAPRMPRFWVFAVGFLLAGAPRFVAIAVTERLWVVYVVSFVAGVSVAAINPIFGALAYERIPERLRARVLGLSRAVSFAGIPLGGLLGGAAVGGLALPATCLLFGFAYLVVTVLPFVSPVWRTMDERPAPESSPVPLQRAAEESPSGGVRASR